MTPFARSKHTGDHADLLRRAAAGDEAGLEALYQATVDGLYAFVFYRVGGDASLAEDAVQETYARAFDDLECYDPDRGSVQSWLCVTSRNVIRDQLRAHRRSSELQAKWQRIDQSLAQIFEALERAPLSDEVIARAETRDLVNMTIANLPDNYRTILEKKYIDGASMAALAGSLSLTEVATKSLLARARRAFRETFSTLCQTLAEVK